MGGIVGLFGAILAHSPIAFVVTSSEDEILLNPFVIVIPITYLFVLPSIQIFLLSYCFDSHIQTRSLWIIYAATATFCSTYAAGFFYRQDRLEPIPAPALSRNALTTIASILLAACVIYIAVSLIRIHERWDSFSLGPSGARFALIRTRIGVTPLGALTAFFLGAPSVLALFVTIYGNNLSHHRFFRASAIIMFAAFAFLVSLEGGRLPYLFALAIVVSAIAYHVIRGGTLRQLGWGFLSGLVIITIASFAFSYKEFSSREAASGRKTAAETRANYSDYVDGSLPAARPPAPAPSTSHPTKAITPPTEAIASPTAPARAETAVATPKSHIVECFYASHTVKSIDRIITKGADRNLHGFYMMPNFYKAAEILGLVKGPWIAYSDYYEITGLFVGVIGAMLIDFSWGAFLSLALVGFVSGRLVSIAIAPTGDSNTFYFLAPVVPAGIILFPLTDMTSISQFQSMIPWLAFVVLALWLYRWRTSFSSSKMETASADHLSGC
jgi:hypothetical protein